MSGLSSLAGASLVFLAAAAELVLEIVAIRLVAPYVGLTLQTSSAVIGTALAAFALGAWLGGRLADREEPGRLLGPLLVISGLLTLVTVPLVRQAGSWLEGRPDGTIVVLLSLMAVFPPAALLSAVAPIVVKLQLRDLRRTGSVVGRLSGIATLGAITATFLTGFVLLSAFPTSKILIGTGALLLVAGGWQLRLRPHVPTTVVTLVVVPLAPWLFALSPNPCQVETDYHCVRVEESPPGSSGRLLRLDTLSHSYVDLADPLALEFEYTLAMAAAIDVVLPAPNPVSGLYVGGGGLTVPRYVAATHPESSATVLEIDPGVAEVSRRYLGADDLPRTDVQIGDGRTGVARQQPGRYDLVVGDAFGGLAVPWHLTTQQAAQDIHRALRPGGLYVVNVIDYRPDAFAKAEIATLSSVFAHVALAAPTGTLSGSGGGNHVILASDQPLPTSLIADRLQTTTPQWGVLDAAATARFADRAALLTDDFAPVDQLITH